MQHSKKRNSLGIIVSVFGFLFIFMLMVSIYIRFNAEAPKSTPVNLSDYHPVLHCDQIVISSDGSGIDCFIKNQ